MVLGWEQKSQNMNNPLILQLMDLIPNKHICSIYIHKTKIPKVYISSVWDFIQNVTYLNSQFKKQYSSISKAGVLDFPWHYATEAQLSSIKQATEILTI